MRLLIIVVIKFNGYLDFFKKKILMDCVLLKDR